VIPVSVDILPVAIFSLIDPVHACSDVGSSHTNAEGSRAVADCATGRGLSAPFFIPTHQRVSALPIILGRV
jgi:hypothetical protein